MGFHCSFNFLQVLLKMDCVMLILLHCFLYLMYKQSALYNNLHATSYAINMHVLKECPQM